MFKINIIYWLEFGMSSMKSLVYYFMFLYLIGICIGTRETILAFYAYTAGMLQALHNDSIAKCYCYNVTKQLQ